MVCVVVFVMLHKTKRKQVKANSTYRESQRIRQDWREARTKSQRPYYYNAVTNESSWDPPSTFNACYGKDNEEISASGMEGAEDAGKNLPPGWHVTTDSDTNRVFWYHDDGESTTWEKPEWVPKGWIPHEDQWEEFTADKGQKYYYNSRTGTTQWEAPGVDRKSNRMNRLATMKRKTTHAQAFDMEGGGGGVPDINGGGRRAIALSHERRWQDERKQVGAGAAAVGIELTDLTQVQRDTNQQLNSKVFENQ